MELQLSDPALLADLRQHFERSGFVTNRVSEDTIEAWRPDAPSPEQECREIEAHLAVWRAMHGEATIELISSALTWLRQHETDIARTSRVASPSRELPHASRRAATTPVTP